MNQKTIVITGGSAGIGAAAARSFRKQGARVMITGRSPATRQLAEEIGADHHIVDFSSFSQVRAFAQLLLAQYPRIDVLANNAGAYFMDRATTEDGHEMTLQVNHLSGFLLTELLRERLEESNAVVINTASGMHRFARLDFGDLEFEHGYNPARAYANSKLMNVLHAMEIAKRYSNVNAVSYHPGGVATRFGRNSRGVVRLTYETVIGRLTLISADKGADTMLWLANAIPNRDWIPGGYYYKRRLHKMSAQATRENARKLWEVSERLTAA